MVVEDVPREANGTAIIADPRNDQTLILTQLHVAFMKFHNRLVDEIRKQPLQPAWVFAYAQRVARWHFQWMVIHDFLPRIVGTVTANAVYKEVAGKAPVISINYYKPTNKANKAFIPVEVSVAAYRLGHSMARPRYTVRDIVDEVGADLKDNAGKDVDVSKVKLACSRALRCQRSNALNGGRPYTAQAEGSMEEVFRDHENAGATRSRKDRQTAPEPKVTRRIDGNLSSPLINMPASAIADHVKSPTNLAIRNLMRGQRFRLPSGQAVARAMGLKALSNEQLSYKLQWTSTGGVEQETLVARMKYSPTIPYIIPS